LEAFSRNIAAPGLKGKEQSETFNSGEEGRVLTMVVTGGGTVGGGMRAPPGDCKLKITGGETTEDLAPGL